MRDDFLPRTIEALAKRALYFCSNPSCRTPTLEPSAVDPEKYIYTGVAAHITAAAPGGPRYDASLSSKDRSSITNGIHLCATCSVKIDKNRGVDFAVDLLRRWKTEHENWVRSLSQNASASLWLEIQHKLDRSYSRDIQMLRIHSKRVQDVLADCVCIESSDSMVNIHRPVADALLAAAIVGSLIVVGEPGTGKSAVQYSALRHLAAEGSDIITLAADKLAAQSVGHLRQELNLNHDLIDVLENWPGMEPAYVFIDALDAAKSDATAQALRDLVGQIKRSRSRWRVIVSIRKFDLRYNHALRRLFVGSPVTGFSDPEFQSVQHINIPALGESEMAQVTAQSPALAKLLAAAGPDLQDLLHIPFNLRLAGEMLSGGVSVESLTPIRTQVELLERYWQERVIGMDSSGESRNALIERAAEIMVDKRNLRVERRQIIQDTADSATLHNLLHAQVLVEWQRSPSSKVDSALLSFAHHILYGICLATILEAYPDGKNAADNEAP